MNDPTADTASDLLSNLLCLEPFTASNMNDLLALSLLNSLSNHCLSDSPHIFSFFFSELFQKWNVPLLLTCSCAPPFSPFQIGVTCHPDSLSFHTVPTAILCRTGCSCEIPPALASNNQTGLITHSPLSRAITHTPSSYHPSLW